MRKNLHILLAIGSLLLIACNDNTVEVAKNNTQKLAKSTSQHKSLQLQLNTLAQQLQVKYNFLSNVETDCPDRNGKKVKHCYAAEIHFSLPEGSTTYFSDNLDWQINYSQVYPSYASQSEQLSLVHLNGDIHQISAKPSFTGFRADEVKTIKLWVKSTLITESELMPNYWLSSDELIPAVIASTQTSFDEDTGLELQPWVVPFTDYTKQIKSAPNDINKYASTTWLYNNEPEVTIDTKQLLSAIIPTPKSVSIQDKHSYLDLAKGLNINLFGNIERKEIKAALARLALLGIKESVKGVNVTIEINKEKAEDWRKGHYQLLINDSAIIIRAQENSGAFYALQSLASLVTVGVTKIPLLEIEDQPHYAYRGQHVDVARNFHSKEFIFALIKQMAAYKLNKLHLHLAEDEGWRLELPSLPELTQVGSKRCLNLSDKQCLQPQLGGAGATDRDGFYSTSDYQEILRMSSEQQKQIITSLDMPGH
jgi:hexosaminidase